MDIRPSRPDDLEELFDLWLGAVRATHHFLTGEEVAFYGRLVREEYLPAAALEVAVDADGVLLGFLGMTGPKIDALFVRADRHGKGIGKTLLAHARRSHAALEVDVNEENAQARAFYRRMGFREVGRSPLDDTGRPHPIVHLRIIPHVVNVDTLEWDLWSEGEHYASSEKRLSMHMRRDKGHIGIKLERVPPGKFSSPFHYHMEEDEFFMVLRGRALLRLGEVTLEVGVGDAISHPRGDRIAHQLYNHTDEEFEMLVVGENRPNEVVYYPDSDKWLIRSVHQLTKNVPREYWDDEPMPPDLAKRPE